MSRPRRLAVLLLAVTAAVGALTACSGGDDPKVTPEDAVTQLMEQEGYSQQGAQCVIDGVKQQNVDIYSFLARTRYKKHEIDVFNTVGGYCVQQYGLNGTMLSNPSVTGANTAP